MRWIAGLMLVAALVWPADSSAGRAAPCSKPHSRTIAESGQVRVYRAGVHVDACSKTTGRRVVLGIAADYVDVYDVALVQIAGPWVAAVQDCYCRSYHAQGLAEIHVVDTRVGAVAVHRVGASRQRAVTDLVLDGGGRVAWISADYGGPPAGPTFTGLRVERADGRSIAELDAGEDIAPFSLALSSGGALYWQRGTGVYSAPLGGRRTAPRNDKSRPSRGGSRH
jgi:hypothetical protein